MPNVLQRRQPSPPPQLNQPKSRELQIFAVEQSVPQLEVRVQGHRGTAILGCALQVDFHKEESQSARSAQQKEAPCNVPRGNDRIQP